MKMGTEVIPDEKNHSFRIGFLFLLLALLFHWALLKIQIHWNTASPPMPVEIQQVDPRKLDQIRKQWQKSKEKGLLLDKNPAIPTAKTAPEDARYFSNRNIRVEKEQKAKETAVLPKPGRPHAEPAQPRSKTDRAHRSETDRAQKAKPSSPNRYPKLGNLGIPFKLKAAPQASPLRTSADDFRSFAEPEGGQQSIEDRNLPTGSEVLLNAQESVYYSFYARLYEAIGPLWQSRLHAAGANQRINPGDYMTSVDVVLDSDGHVQEVIQLRGSGIREFDQAVVQAWKQLPQFPNPPRGLLDKDNRVHTGWSFTVHVGEGFGVQVRPPERIN